MKRLSLNAKIFMIIGILLTGGGIVAGVAWSKLKFINAAADSAMNDEVKQYQLVTSIREEQRQFSITLRNIIIEREQDKMNAMEQDLNKIIENWMKLVDQYIATTEIPKELE